LVVSWADEISTCRAPKECAVRRFDGGAGQWATVASLIETCKLNDVDPLGYLTDILARIVNGHPNRDIDQLLPWAYRKQELKAVA
jgi:transposase